MARAHCAITTFDPNTNVVMTSATVNVYTPGTVTPIPATIFDKNGNTLANPLTSDSVTGLVDFYLAVAQEVDLVISKASFNTRTYSNVPVLDDASNSLTALLTTLGDMAYASANNTPARLPIASTANAILAANGGIPAWSTTVVNPAAGGLTISSGALSVSAGDSNLIKAATSTGNSLVIRPFDDANSTTIPLVVQNAAGGANMWAVTKAGAVTQAAGLVVTSGGVIMGGSTPTSAAGQLALGPTTAAPGGGSTATLATIGGSGPTTAGQNLWLKISTGGTTAFIPVWV